MWAAVYLTGVDGAALVYDAVLNEGVGADDAARTDDRSAAQDGTGQNDGTRGDDHVRCDLHGAAVDDHAVCDVLQQNDLAGGFGGIQLLTRCIQRSQKKQNFPYDRSPFRHGGSRRVDDKAPNPEK